MSPAAILVPCTGMTAPSTDTNPMCHPLVAAALLAHHQPVPYTPAAALQLGLDLYQEAAAAGLLPHEALVSGGARLLALSGAYEEVRYK